jgi:acyl dehydratase
VRPVGAPDHPVGRDSGDRLTVKREVVELRRSRSNPRNGVVRTRIAVVNQAGETVLSMLATGMIAARGDG